MSWRVLSLCWVMVVRILLQEVPRIEAPCGTCMRWPLAFQFSSWFIFIVKPPHTIKTTHYLFDLEYGGCRWPHTYDVRARPVSPVPPGLADSPVRPVDDFKFIGLGAPSKLAPEHSRRHIRTAWGTQRPYSIETACARAHTGCSAPV